MAYFRIPAADFRGKTVEADGVLMYEFQAIATRPSTGVPLYMGVG
jgi:hypothetical protein